jgi:hypothetical protein
MAEIREQKGHIPEASEIQSRGHGGKRIKGLVGVSADEHDFIESQIVLYFDQWFETEKKEHASHSPNPDPNEKGIYQQFGFGRSPGQWEEPLNPRKILTGEIRDPRRSYKAESA